MKFSIGAMAVLLVVSISLVGTVVLTRLSSPEATTIASDRSRAADDNGTENRASREPAVDSRSVVDSTSGDSGRESRRPQWDELSLPQLWPRQYGGIEVDRLADSYENLRLAAEAGSPSAARELFYGLRRCRSAFTERRELEAAVDQLYQTHTYPLADGGTVHAFITGEPPNDLETNERALRMDFAFCEDVTDEWKAEAENWRDRAIENGAVDVALEYAYHTTDSARRAEAFLLAFDLGAISALSPLSELFEQGWPGQEPDKVTAYAYAYLSAELLKQATGKDSMLAMRTEQILIEKTRLMHRYQLNEARDVARQILQSNPSCCMDMKSSGIAIQSPP